MRIGIIAQMDHAIAEPFAGGLERHTHLLAQRLRAAGHDVRLYAADGSDPSLEPVTCGAPTGPVQEACRGRPAVRLAVEAVAFAQYRMQGRVMRDLIQNPPDIVHNNSLHELPLMLAHQLPCPMVTVLHEAPNAVLDMAVAERQDQDMSFVAMSSDQALCWEGQLGSRLPVIGGGIALEPWRPCLRSGPDIAPHAVWCGAIAPGQGLMMALQAALIAGMPLLIAGPIEDAAFWRDRIRPRLRGGSRHLGALDPAGLGLALAAATVAVCTPRSHDPYALGAAEALACGTPIAGFAQGALPDIIDIGSGRLAPPGDVPALARCVLAAARLRRADCRRRAEDACDGHHMVALYEAAYRTAIARHRQPRTMV